MEAVRAHLVRHRWLLSSAAAAILLLLLRAPARPRRLAEVGAHRRFLGALNGTAYLMAGTPYLDHWELRSLPEDGGRVRVLASGSGPAATLEWGHVRPEGVFLLFAHHRPAADYLRQVPRQPSRTPVSGEGSGWLISYRLLRVPLEGGTPAPVLPPPPHGGLPAGDWLYWLEPGRPGQPARLMARRLRGGSVREVGRGPAGDLYAVGDRLFWRRPGGGPESAALFASRNGEPAREAVAAYGGIGGPALLEDRLYWLEGAGPGAPVAEDNWRLVSAPAEGGQPRIVLAARDVPGTVAWLAHPSAHNGRLYALGGVPENAALGGNPDRSRSFLCRFHLDGRPRLEEACPDPGALERVTWGSTRNCAFDGDSYYFTATELKERWWDWSPAGLGRAPAIFLFRCRLPR